MKLLSRREYNLILRSLDKYELYMNSKEKQLSEDLQDKLVVGLLKDTQSGVERYVKQTFNRKPTEPQLIP